MQPASNVSIHDLPSMQNPFHSCFPFQCTFATCAQCTCASSDPPTAHCKHCYHCRDCSTAVSRLCRKCDFSPEPSKYWYYCDGWRGCDQILGGQECRICYTDNNVYEFLDRDPSPDIACRVDQTDEKRLAANGAEAKLRGDKNEGYTPPGSPPRKTASESDGKVKTSCDVIAG